MQARILFSGPPDIYDYVYDQKDKLKRAYDGLSDEQALDETFTQDFKKRFMLDVPRLRPDEWTSDRKELTPHLTEIVAYIPFDGDPNAFKIKPSAFKMTHAQGEVVGQELLIRVQPLVPKFDVAGYVKGQLGEVEWRLESLRGSMAHMDQELEAQIRQCIQLRKRSIEHKREISENLGIPQRKPPVASASSPARTSVVTNPIQVKPQPETWDIFMSHASPDKLYVHGLVKALRAVGVSVWFDEDCIKPGEPSRQAIKNGLKNSTYGIVVLSHAYIADRKWTEHEFDGLFARERLNSFIIMPVWHGVTREEIEAYDPALADRNSISKTDNYNEIAQNILRLLGRVPGEGVSTPTEAPATPLVGTFKPDELELVAYVWYYTGDGKGAQMYVRKVRAKDDLFTLEEPNGPMHLGTREEISDKYSSIDRRLLRTGLRHHVRNASSAYSDFVLAG